MDNIQSSQLEAFRLLLTDENLRNEILARGLGSQGATPETSNSPRTPVKTGGKTHHQSKTTSKSKSHGSKSTARVHKAATHSSQSGATAAKSQRLQDQTSSWKWKAAHPQSVVQKHSGKSLARSRNPSSQLSPPPTHSYPAVEIFYNADPENGTVSHPSNSRKFVVGLDYGTTFTTVSYLAYPKDEESPSAFPSDVKSIMNWNLDGNGGVRKQLPTESWYSALPITREAISSQFDIGGDDSEDEYSSQAKQTRPTTTCEQATDPLVDSGIDSEESSRYLWGYEVPYQRYRANTSRNEIRRIERPKLMLVSRTEKHTQRDREKLRPRLDHLIKMKIIRKYGKKDKPDVRDVQDVITDFLIKVFAHTKQQLIENEGLMTEDVVEFVLSVPARWTPNGSRVLQFAVEAAIRTTGFGTLGNGSVEKLFIITEPEAAATFLLGSSHSMLAEETFIVLDCGGGTVDGVTYTVTSEYPLGLKMEVGQPTGDNCGASYLNDNFEAQLLERLKNEKYLEHNGETLESIVRHLVPHFEDYEKRLRDITKRPSSRIKIGGLLGDSCRGLTGSSAKRFDDNYIILNSDDYNEIFLPLLRRVANVLRGQLEVAISETKDVKKVFLIGGFGAAPSLRSFLAKFLVDFSRESKLSYEINLITRNEQDSVTAMASGAVLRALNKDGGPQRKTCSGYGFLRMEPFQPEYFEAHRGVHPTRDPLDGEDYVLTIDYFMIKGTILPPMHRFKPYVTYHAFEADNLRLLCEEVLYVSDHATESHYPLDHPENRDVQVAGKIITDMTFLRDQVTILPIFPVPNENGDLQGKVHYQVRYDLVAIIEGRNLKYEARYPADPTGKAQKTGQISIAAAFKPGTG